MSARRMPARVEDLLALHLETQRIKMRQSGLDDEMIEATLDWMADYSRDAYLVANSPRLVSDNKQ